MSSLVQASFVATGQVQSLDSVRTHALPSDALIFASPSLVTPTNQNPGSYIVNDQVSGATPTINGSVPAVTASPFADLYKEGSVFINGVAANYISTALTGYTMSQGISMEMFVNYQNFTNSTYTIGFMAASAATYNFTLGVNGSAAPIVTWTGGTLVSSVTVSANTWNHLACSWDGTTLRLYVNGALGNSTSFTPPTLAQNFLVGRANSLTCTAYVTDVRIVTNPAVYVASTLTVPSAPLSPAAAGTTNFMLRIGQNSPTIQNGALTFDRGLRQFMNFGPQTFNIVTQGFTAVWRGAFTGTPASYERLFAFGTDATNGYMAALRLAAGSSIYFFICPSNSTSAQAIYLTTTIVQGTTYVFTFRYNPVTQILDAWTNGVQVASSPVTTSTLVADRILSPVVVGGYNTQGTTSLASNTLAIYNRALSNVEIYNSYLALNTVPATPQQKTLEIGDINGTPALSVAGDGKVFMDSVGLTSNVVPWPPAAMTGYDTVINGGVYKARASTEYPGQPPWYAFEKGGSQWSTNGSLYSASTFLYTGTSTTTDVNGTVYPGEWLQIQIPSPVTVSSYSITPTSSPGSGTSSPANFVVLGSRDGVNWFSVNSQAGITSWSSSTPQTFTVASGQAYTYYRIVINKLNGNNQNAVILEWTLYGTADASPTLTIAPATTFNTAVATPSLTGIAGSAFVPQDFSSSGLNVPAYVVSNTATAANTVQYSSMGPFAGEGSLYFPGGTGAYVNFGNQIPLWTGGNQDVTIEAWFYATQFAASNTPIIVRAPSTTSGSAYSWGVFMYLGSISFAIYNQAGPTYYAATINTTIPLNTWNHIAATYSGGVLRVFLNGVLGTARSDTLSGVPFYSSSSVTMIANWTSTAGNQFYGSIANLRIVSGLALYTTTFTPPTAPLQPIQGVTQAGLPYGTVLLLRNAPAPGRIQTTKFSGANSGTVLSFPPAAMTTYATALASGYGQGTYVASASTEYTPGAYYAWYAFDKSAGTQWGASFSYTTNVPYGGTVRTVDVNGTSYAGEWLQIQKPSSIVLSSYSILPQSGAVNTLSAWYVLGSRDGTSWFLIDQRSGATWTSGVYNTYQVQSSQAFNYFRIVINIVSNGTGIGLPEWTLNGSIESVNVTADGRLGVGVTNPARALEVAGDVVCGGTLSAGNPLMFRNAIINGDMRVNQRGISTNWASPTAIGTSASGLNYSLDRMNHIRGAFSTGGGTAQLTLASTDSPFTDGLRNYLRVGRVSGNGATDFISYAQALESRESYRFAGQPATFSLYYRTGSGFSGANLSMALAYGTGTDQNGVASAFTNQVTRSITLSASNAWQRATLTTFIGPASTQLLGYVLYNPTGTAGGFDYFDITGVQLEKGSVATPFEVRPFATELALCQRYYQVFGPGNTSGYNRFGAGHAPDTTHGLVIIPFQVNMRAASTTFSNSAPNTFQLNSGAAAPVATNISTGDTSPTSAQLYVTVASGLTAGYGVICIGSGTTTAYVGFGAEL